MPAMIVLVQNGSTHFAVLRQRNIVLQCEGIGHAREGRALKDITASQVSGM